MRGGRLGQRLRRVDTHPVVRRKRAAAAAPPPVPPSPFDRWLLLIQCAQGLPNRIPDPELAAWASGVGAAIAVLYYEHGSDVVRDRLAGQEWAAGEGFTDEQVARVLAWCTERFRRQGGHYLHPLGDYAQWRHIKARYTPEERAFWRARMQRFRQAADTIRERGEPPVDAQPPSADEVDRLVAFFTDVAARPEPQRTPAR